MEKIRAAAMHLKTRGLQGWIWLSTNTERLVKSLSDGAENGGSCSVTSTSQYMRRVHTGGVSQKAISYRTAFFRVRDKLTLKICVGNFHWCQWRNFRACKQRLGSFCPAWDKFAQASMVTQMPRTVFQMKRSGTPP